MKVLWLCNKEPALISNIRNTKQNPFGGWLDGILDKILENESIDLVCAYPGKYAYEGEYKNVHYISFISNEARIVLRRKILSEEPEVIHVFGTEYKHSFELTEVCKELDCIGRVVISIQGLVSVYAKHFTGYLPNNVVRRKTFRDIVRHDNIKQAQKNFENKGIFEIKTIKNVNYVIGRTDWDRACTYFINDSCKYFTCNESLRNSFYEYKWNLSEVEEYSIFTGSCAYPLKGFHILLEALTMLNNKYNCKVYVPGRDVFKIPWYRISSYHLYLRSYIEQHRLKENIVFLGELSEEGIRSYMLKANLYVLPSVIENSPNTLGEAMLLGCPCIAADVGGVRNLLNDVDEGFIYPADEPYMLAYYIDRVFQMGRNVEKMTQKASEHAKKTHNREKNFEDLICIYNTILEETR